MRIFLYIVLAMLSGCVGIPEGIKPVNDFEVSRYLGHWYEIARLDHSFERGMEMVSAEYVLDEDDKLKVINRGFDTKRNQWKEVEGKALFVGDSKTAHLKVSFFGPFYGSYIVFELDEQYQYAFITSSNKSYLWLLSRTPHIDDNVKQQFIERVTELGFDKKEIIFVKQSGEISDSTLNELTSQ